MNDIARMCRVGIESKEGCEITEEEKTKSGEERLSPRRYVGQLHFEALDFVHLSARPL